MTDPPVYRLRHDREVPDNVSERLIRLWEAAGLPYAGDSIIAQEINEGAFEPSRSDARAFFYLRKSGLNLRPGFPGALVPSFVEHDSNHKKMLKHLTKWIQSLTDENIKSRGIRWYLRGHTDQSIERYLHPIDETTGLGLIDFFQDQLHFAVYHRY